MSYVWLVLDDVWIRCIEYRPNKLTGRASIETYDHRLFDNLRFRQIGYGGVLCEK